MFFFKNLAGILLVSFSLFSVACADPAVKQEKPVLSVTVVQPRMEQWQQLLQVSGGIFPWQEAIVASEIGGLAVTSIVVDVGSVVKKGDELLQLSDASVKASVALQRANVARAKAGLALAKANGDRARSVKDSGALSEQQITQYVLQEESAQAEWLAAQASLTLEEVRLRQTRIVAADDGVIVARTASLGAVVQVGSELFRLVRQGRLEWRAEVTATQGMQLKPGQQARLTLSSGETLQAALRQIAPTQDATTRKGVAYFDIPKESPGRAGMFAQGEIQLGEERVMTVPLTSIVMSDGFAYIFELSGKDRVIRRKVTLSQSQGDRMAIRSGLEDKAKVVVTGGAFLKDGDRVLVLEATP